MKKHIFEKRKTPSSPSHASLGAGERRLRRGNGSDSVIAAHIPVALRLKSHHTRHTKALKEVLHSSTYSLKRLDSVWEKNHSFVPGKPTHRSHPQ